MCDDDVWAIVGSGPEGAAQRVVVASVDIGGRPAFDVESCTYATWPSEAGRRVVDDYCGEISEARASRVLDGFDVAAFVEFCISEQHHDPRAAALHSQRGSGANPDRKSVSQ